MKDYKVQFEGKKGWTFHPIYQDVSLQEARKCVSHLESTGVKARIISSSGLIVQ